MGLCSFRKRKTKHLLFQRPLSARSIVSLCSTYITRRIRHEHFRSPHQPLCPGTTTAISFCERDDFVSCRSKHRLCVIHPFLTLCCWTANINLRSSRHPQSCRTTLQRHSAQRCEERSSEKLILFPTLQSCSASAATFAVQFWTASRQTIMPSATKQGEPSQSSRIS